MAGQGGVYFGAVLGGRYKIVRELGRGGFATVYEAQDETLLKKRVVVKVLHTAKIDEWLLRKFRQEKEALARIDDPGVVAVLDEGKTPGNLPYLVMQYVDGVTLRKLVKPGGMAAERAAEILRQIGCGLAAAHKEKVLHRDLKPENVMIQEGENGDRVRLIDFGIAGITDSVYSSDTQSTRVAGTYRYMPPEQAEGDVSEKSDIYALAVVGFELLTGAAPVDTPIHRLTIEKDGIEKKLRSLRPDLPEAAVAVLLEGLAIDPEARPASARLMAERLYAALRPGTAAAPVEVETPVAATAGGGSRRWFLGIAGAAVLAAGGAWVYRNAGSKPETVAPPPPVVRSSLSYFVTVQKMKDGKPDGEPFRLEKDILFQKDDQVAITVTAPAAGYLYVLNDGPLDDGTQSINVLYPDPGKPAALGAGKEVRLPAEDWWQVDQMRGTEKLYVVFSALPVLEFEKAKDDKAALKGVTVVIRKPEEVAALRGVLSKHTAQTAMRNDPEKALNVLTSTGEVLVYQIRLQHY